MLKSEIKKDLMRAIETLFCASDALKVFLILAFSILYLPHAFILVDDLGLIYAYESDPGSVIYAIEDILRTYNMHSGYHSKYYGWTYFAINCILLMPIKIFCLLFNIESKFYLYSAIKLIFFSIGLISLIAFYELLKKLFANKILPFIGAIFFILSDAGYQFFYFIHPETTGAMFIFFALLCLTKFIKNTQDYKIYFYGLIFLVLASLSKQTFLFISLPILALFFHFYCVNQRIKYIDFIISKKFAKIFGYTSVIAIGTLFVIHPYSILEFKKFFKFQMELKTMFVVGENIAPSDKLFELWKDVFFSVPIIKLSAFLFPASFILSAIYYVKSKNAKCLLYIANLFVIILASFLIITCNRLFIGTTYIQPIYPFFIINFLSMIAFIMNVDFKKFQIVKVCIIVFFVYFATLSITRSVYYNVTNNFDRFNYKDSVVYLTYDYIKNNITPVDKVVHDHFVAFPSILQSYSCHYWRDCATNEDIDKYHPNYVMLNEDFMINNKKYGPTENLKRYIKEQKLALVGKLSGKDKLSGKNITISIYKKL